MKRYRVGYATRDGNTHEWTEHDTLPIAKQFHKRAASAYPGAVWFVVDMDNPERGDVSDYSPED